MTLQPSYSTGSPEATSRYWRCHPQTTSLAVAHSLRTYIATYVAGQHGVSLPVQPWSFRVSSPAINQSINQSPTCNSCFFSASQRPKIAITKSISISLDPQHTNSFPSLPASFPIVSFPFIISHLINLASAHAISTLPTAAAPVHRYHNRPGSVLCSTRPLPGSSSCRGR